jgi:hypothetical protein
MQPLKTELDQLKMTNRAQEDQISATLSDLVELKKVWLLSVSFYLLSADYRAFIVYCTRE